MQIDIVAVGRMKAGPELELLERYSDRFSRAGKSLHFAGPRVLEIAESRSGDAAIRKREEAAAILAKLGNGFHLVMMDERGSDVSSEELARWLEAEQANGVAGITFALGGPDGHGEDVKQAAKRSIRFGSQTWPHQLARIMLAEQLYRAMTILSGHPYHRA